MAYCPLWYQANKERRKEIMRRYRERHPERVKAAARSYVERNPEKVKEIHRRKHEADKARRNAFMRAWKRAHPESVVGYQTKRRAMKAGNGGSHTPKQWLELCARVGGKCVKCGAVDNLTRDHIQPISQGGTDSIENIQPLCLRCNVQKRTATIAYLPQQPFREATASNG